MFVRSRNTVLFRENGGQGGSIKAGSGWMLPYSVLEAILQHATGEVYAMRGWDDKRRDYDITGFNWSRSKELKEQGRDDASRKDCCGLCGSRNVSERPEARMSGLVMARYPECCGRNALA